MWERAPGAIELPASDMCMHIESLFHPLACSVLAVLMREKRSSMAFCALLFVKWHIGSVGNHLYDWKLELQRTQCSFLAFASMQQP